MSLNIATIRQDNVAEGKVAVYWLSGSAFAFKFSGGEILCIDPYLSDQVERLCGMRRLAIPPVTADTLAFDALLITHDHEDHLDMDSFDAMMAANPGARILAPECCWKPLDSRGAKYDAVRPGTETTIGEVTVTTVDADHGELCATAVGYLITFAGRTIYFTGDTCLNMEAMKDAIEMKPEIIIPCINGVYGNLSSPDAAALTALCGSGIAIPSHFWLFAEQYGSPGDFVQSIAQSAPNAQALLLTPGRGVEI